jgi:hypothetical protein
MDKMQLFGSALPRRLLSGGAEILALADTALCVPRGAGNGAAAVVMLVGS